MELSAVQGETAVASKSRSPRTVEMPTLDGGDAFGRTLLSAKTQPSGTTGDIWHSHAQAARTWWEIHVRQLG
jgi:hypothetical protein